MNRGIKIIRQEKLIYDHIKDTPQQQIEFANQLDDKMLRIFTAASIVIGLLGLSASGGGDGRR